MVHPSCCGGIRLLYDCFCHKSYKEDVYFFTSSLQAMEAVKKAFLPWCAPMERVVSTSVTQSQIIRSLVIFIEIFLRYFLRLYSLKKGHGWEWRKYRLPTCRVWNQQAERFPTSHSPMTLRNLSPKVMSVKIVGILEGSMLIIISVRSTFGSSFLLSLRSLRRFGSLVLRSM